VPLVVIIYGAEKYLFFFGVGTNSLGGVFICYCPLIADRTVGAISNLFAKVLYYRLPTVLYLLFVLL